MSKKLLFLCMGNICRSPAAHAAMEKLLRDSDDSDLSSWSCDSAGLTSYHAGELPDRRMREHAQKRGLTLDHRARQIRSPADFETFDFIFYMDDDNEEGLKQLDPTGKYRHKCQRLTDYCSKKCSEVPDPYYGGAAGFEHVLDIVEDACAGILQKLRK